MDYVADNNWPKKTEGELKHYFNIKDSILVSDSLLFKDDKLIIPREQKQTVL